MKKKIFSVLAACLLVLILFVLPVRVSAEATSGSCGAVGNESSVTWQLDGDTLTINGNGAMADYYSVSETPWNSSVSSIKTVMIGEGVTYIGKNAFWGFDNLETVQFSNTVECIGDCAFMNCSNLKSPTFPASITKICRQAFASCDALDTLVLTGVTEIEYRAFEECSAGEFSEDLDTISQKTGLKSVSMPELTVMGERAFARCFNLETVSMSKLTTISSEGFSNCRMLRSIDMPSVTQIGNNAFDGNPTLEILEIENVVSIG